MQIDVKKDGTTTTIAPVGAVDYVTAAELDAAVEKESASANMLVIDLQKVDYISSAGLRSILNADDLMSGKNGIRLVNVNPDVRSVLEMTNFTSFLKIE